MYRDVKMAVIMKLIYIFLVLGSLEESVFRDERPKGVTAWIRAFYKAIQQCTNGAFATPIWCECEKEIYQTGQGHLHKASVRSTVHLQIEQRRRAKVKKRNQKKRKKTHDPDSC